MLEEEGRKERGESRAEPKEMMSMATLFFFIFLPSCAIRCQKCPV